MNGEILKLLRITFELSRSDCAKLLQITPNYYADLESGRKVLNFKLMKKISDVYQIPISQLLYVSKMYEAGYKTRMLLYAIMSYDFKGIDINEKNYPIPPIPKLKNINRVGAISKIAVVWDEGYNISVYSLSQCRKCLNELIKYYNVKEFVLVDGELNTKTSEWLKEGRLWDNYDAVIYMPRENMLDIHFNIFTTLVAKQNGTLNKPVVVFNPEHSFDKILSSINYGTNFLETDTVNNYLISTDSFSIIKYLDDYFEDKKSRKLEK